jgi:small subunit ribosomal protein S2
MSRIQEMFEVGAHYGYSRTRRHPTTKQFIYGSKNRTDIIDIEKTETQLAKAEELLKSIAATGRQVIFVGTKPELRDLVKTTAESMNMPFVDERWIGGTLTNWKQIKSRVTTLDDLSGKSEESTLTYSTKKEKLLIERKIEKLNRRFGGLGTLKGIPAAIVVIDAREEINAVTESHMMGVPVIAIANTDTDITLVDYPIIANDNSRKSVDFFLKQFAQALKTA